MRLLTQSAFVDEDDRAALFSGFFLMAGQVLRCQPRMASSLRSRARPTDLAPENWTMVNERSPAASPPGAGPVEKEQECKANDTAKNKSLAS